MDGGRPEIVVFRFRGGIVVEKRIEPDVSNEFVIEWQWDSP